MEDSTNIMGTSESGENASLSDECVLKIFLKGRNIKEAQLIHTSNPLPILIHKSGQKNVSSMPE